jgi:formamidopyrimidine-DNA glycosylase
MLENIDVRSLRNSLRGKQFYKAVRHGKYLFAGITGGKWLVVHFGMTGFLDDVKKRGSP